MNVEEREWIGDEEFMRRFESGSLPVSPFHHSDHIRLAWLYLKRYGLHEALVRVSD